MKAGLEFKSFSGIFFTKAEKATLFRSIYNQIVTSAIDPAKINMDDAFLDELQMFSQKGVETTNVIRKSEVTPEIEALDGTRDSLLSFFCVQVRSYVNSPLAEQRAMAALLKPVVDEYAGIQRDYIPVETQRVLGLLNDISKEKYELAVVKLNLSDCVSELTRVNNEISKKLDARTKGAETAITAAEFNRQFAAYWKRIMLLIESAYVLSNNEEDMAAIEGLVVNINNEIQKMKNIYARRTGGKEEPETSSEVN